MCPAKYQISQRWKGSKLQKLGLLADTAGLRTIEQFGFNFHLEILGQDRLKVLNRLFGRLIWANPIEPKWGEWKSN
jgi:hypothetical protein